MLQSIAPAISIRPLLPMLCSDCGDALLLQNGFAQTFRSCWRLASKASAAWLPSRMMTSLLLQVTPTDPIVYSSVSVILLLVAVLASYLPARRASRIDPMVALRTE